MNDLFHQFAKRASDASGSPWAFAISVIVLLAWAVTGPFFHFSDTWQLTINTASSIIPTIMVFLIQNTQNRDARALHLKIDELLRIAEGGKSPFINLQELSDEEVDWHAFQHEADVDAERGVLFSIARRRSLSRSDDQYEKRLQEEVRRGDRLARENVDLAEKVRMLELDLYLAERGLQADMQSPAELKAAIRRKIA